MIGWQGPNGLDSNNMAQKEKSRVDLEVREGQNYTGGKLPKKKEMWWIYGILIIVAAFIISSILSLF